MLLDARIYQIAFLLFFLLVGLLTRDWTLHPAAIATAVTVCFTAQVIVSGSSAPAKSLPSALITALGLSLLLRVDHPSTMMLAAGAAIASKFLLRVGEKHLFNPANFGIVAALTLTQDAWVSPGQWGEAGWLVLLFGCAGGLVLGTSRTLGYQRCFSGCLWRIGSRSHGLAGLDLGCLGASVDERLFAAVCAVYDYRPAHDSQCSGWAVDLGKCDRHPNVLATKLLLSGYGSDLGTVSVGSADAAARSPVFERSV